MFYSSGTTGRPKGIKPVSPPDPDHKAVSPLLMLAAHAFGWPTDGSVVYLSPGPLYHAAPFRWTMTAHSLGGTVVVMEKFDAEAALAAIHVVGSLPADEALGQWMQRSLDLLATKRGLGDALRTLLVDRPDLMAVGRAGFPDRLQELVEAAIASGRIRPDVEVADVMQALSGIYSAPPSPDWRARSGRVIELLMDGLRFRG